MIGYIAQRLIYAIVTFLFLSIVVFIIIQLPPGDFLTSYVARLEQEGDIIDEAEIEALKQEYGLDATPVEKYVRWFGRFLRGEMGRSFEWNQPVGKLLRERLPYTILLSLITLFFTYVVAVPIGIYVATRQYGFSDYLFSVLGFAGLATPNFMLALILMFLFFKYFGISVGGLFSSEYALAPWSLAKVWDLFTHLWVPIIVIGTAGTAGIIRVMRGTLLDELRQTVCHHRPRQGCCRREAAVQVPGAHGDQSDRQYGRLAAAAHRFRRDDRRHRSESADYGSSSFQGADQPGHVFGRKYCDVSGNSDVDRNLFV